MKPAALLILLVACAAHGDLPPYVAPPTLNFDLTSGNSYTNLPFTRTGGTFYLQTSPSTVAATTNAQLCEDRNDGCGIGCWNFDAYNNDAPNPFDFRVAAGWGYNGNGDSQHIVVDDTTAPDGTVTADRLTDPNATYYDYNRAAGASAATIASNISSSWIEDYSSSPPTLAGALTMSAINATNFVAGLGTGTTWRRISGATTKAATGVAAINIYYAGVTANGNGSTLTASATGSIEAWGAQATQAEGDVPLVSTNTTATVIQPSGSLSGMLQPAANDVRVSVSWINDPLYATFQSTETVYPVSFTTADGLSGIFFNSQSVINGKLNGGAAGNKNVVTFANYGAIEVTAELFSIASGNISGVQMWVNGCRLAGQSANRGAAVTMHAPTGAWVGSNQANAASYMPRRYTSVNFASTADVNRGEGVILSDSIIAAYQGKPSACAFIYTLPESRARGGIVSQATPGDRISDQYTFWTNASYCQQRGAASLKWVLIQLGLNDGLQNRTETQMVTDMNTLIADINTQNPTAKILLYPPTPAHGGSGGLSDAQWAIVSAFILDVQGIGAQSISGSNIVRFQPWNALTSPGSNGVLAPWADYGDGIHTNYQARGYQGDQFRAGLIANGLL